MTGILRASLFATLLSLSIPAAAAAQAASSDSLLRRIEFLERTTIDLERRVRELETLLKGEPVRARPTPASANWRDLQNWRRLRLGMTTDEVRALLGEPERVDANQAFTLWYYDYNRGTRVSFNSDSGTVDGWSEPRR